MIPAQAPAPIESLVANPFAGYELARRSPDEVEAALLAEDQVDCPVVHRFGPGIYIREVTLPAGTLAVGHRHRTAHTNIVLQGRVLVVNDNGSTTTIDAPYIYTSQPGRKVVIAITETVWQNIFATEETDVQALEDRLLDKSPAWLADQDMRHRVNSLQRENDRLDYLAALDSVGMTPEQAEAISLNTKDLIPMPQGSYKFTLGESAIHGRGIKATASMEDGEVVGPARIGTMRTPLGRYTNHSATPNAAMHMGRDGNIYLVATRYIAGCQGGQPGEEITIDYRQAFDVAGRATARGILCQQSQ